MRTVQSVGMGIFVNLSALRIVYMDVFVIMGPVSAVNQCGLMIIVRRHVQKIVTMDVIEKVENVYHVDPVGMVKTVNVLVIALWTVV